MNRPGTIGFSGTTNGDTTEAIYQEIEGSSDLYLYDLETHTRSTRRRAVNSSAWECRPVDLARLHPLRPNRFRRPAAVEDHAVRP